jgi:hypothetical protein
MAVSELVREAAERRKGLTDLSKQVRAALKAGTRLFQLINRIRQRKVGLPSFADLETIVAAISELISAVAGLSKLIPYIRDIFKIIG